jgi:hypothetical protein
MYALRVGLSPSAPSVVGQVARVRAFHTERRKSSQLHGPCGHEKPGWFNLDRLILTVKDIDAARADLISRGVDVGEVYEARPPGFDSKERSYFAYASFKDPDGNGWLLQEVTSQLPGRERED